MDTRFYRYAITLGWCGAAFILIMSFFCGRGLSCTH